MKMSQAQFKASFFELQTKTARFCNVSIIAGKRSAVILTADKRSALPTAARDSWSKICHCIFYEENLQRQEKEGT